MLNVSSLSNAWQMENERQANYYNDACQKNIQNDTYNHEEKVKVAKCFFFLYFFLKYLYVVIYFDMFYFLYIYICMENSSTMSEIQRLVPLSVLCANWSLEACYWQGNHGNPCWGHG